MRLFAKKIDTETSSKLIADTTAFLRSLGPIQRIILFGSGARGQLTEASDLDFALIFESDQDKSAFKKIALTSRRPHDIPVDFLFYTQNEFDAKLARGGTAEIIADEGRVVFDSRSEHTTAKTREAVRKI
jgi:predicted nucleotidyltransferase